MELTIQELHAEMQAMYACEVCQLFDAAQSALLVLSPADESLPQLLSTSEWHEAQLPVSDASRRHRAEAHPRYDAHIMAGVALRRQARLELSESV